MPKEPSLCSVEGLDQPRSGTGERVPAAERVIGVGDGQELGRRGGSMRGKTGEPLSFDGGYALVLVAVDDEPRRPPVRRRGQEVELGAVRFQVLQQAEAEGELLAGAGVDHRQLAVAPPGLLL